MAARAASLGDKGKNGQKKVEIWGWRWDMGNAFMLISFCKTVLESFSFVFVRTISSIPTLPIGGEKQTVTSLHVNVSIYRHH